MKRLLVPAPVEMPNMPIKYSHAHMLDEFVCNDPRWRSEWNDSFPDLKKYHEAVYGETKHVDVSDKAKERIEQCLMSPQISGPAAFRLMDMITAVTKAQEPPSDAPEAATT